MLFTIHEAFDPLQNLSDPFQRFLSRLIFVRRQTRRR
jgi:hypothetical protein